MTIGKILNKKVRLPPLPSISEILKIYNLRARRQLSQNFLMDPRLNDRLTNCCGKLVDYEVCEVGPGPGNITRAILSRQPKRIYLLEKDERFLPILDMLKKSSPVPIHIILGDVMRQNMENMFLETSRRNWEDECPPIHIVGNLPFQVSTALIIKWMRAISEKNSAWSFGRVCMTLTFQKEVAQRIEAPIMSQHRSRLSIMCQNWCDISYRMHISGKSFVPPPNVDVGVIHFKPLVKPVINLPFNVVEKVVRSLFRSRTKNYEKGLRSLFQYDCQQVATQEIINRSGVSKDLRCFQLGIKDIRNICLAYNSLTEEHPEFLPKLPPAEVDWISRERESEFRSIKFDEEKDDEFY